MQNYHLVEDDRSHNDVVAPLCKGIACYIMPLRIARYRIMQTHSTRIMTVNWQSEIRKRGTRCSSSSGSSVNGHSPSCLCSGVSDAGGFAAATTSVSFIARAYGGLKKHEPRRKKQRDRKAYRCNLGGTVARKPER